MIRVFGTEPLALSESLGALIDEVLPVVPADQRIAWRAGELHATHDHQCARRFRWRIAFFLRQRNLMTKSHPRIQP